MASAINRKLSKKKRTALKGRKEQKDAHETVRVKAALLNKEKHPSVREGASFLLKEKVFVQRSSKE